jgi:hypothetical protein
VNARFTRIEAVSELPPRGVIEKSVVPLRNIRGLICPAREQSVALVEYQRRISDADRVDDALSGMRPPLVRQRAKNKATLGGTVIETIRARGTIAIAYRCAVVVRVPSVVTRLHVPGTYGGSSSNFIVWCGTQLFVNEVIGTSSVARTTTCDGTHQLTAPGVRDADRTLERRLLSFTPKSRISDATN